MDAVLDQAVIADARRRQRRRRLLWLTAAVAVLALGTGGYGLFGRGGSPSRSSASQAARHGSTPPPSLHAGPLATTLSVWVIWAAPDSKEIVKPFGRSIALFRRPRRYTDIVPAAVLGAPFPKAPTFAEWMARYGAKEGKPLLAKSREVDSLSDSVYFVPTTRGKVCFVSWRGSEGCMEGLTREGISWRLQDAPGDSGLAIFGLASPSVSRIDWAWGITSKQADLTDGAFTVERPFTFSGRLPKSFGQLVVHYHDGRHPAVVPIR